MIEEPQEVAGIVAEGAASFRHGLPRENCPYPPGASEREEWLKGWDHAASSPA